jgi:hypothetical protein
LQTWGTFSTLLPLILRSPSSSAISAFSAGDPGVTPVTRTEFLYAEAKEPRY